MEKLICLRDFPTIPIGRRIMESFCQSFTDLSFGMVEYKVEDLGADEFADDKFRDGYVKIRSIFPGDGNISPELRQHMKTLVETLFPKTIGHE